MVNKHDLQKPGKAVDNMVGCSCVFSRPGWRAFQRSMRKIERFVPLLSYLRGCVPVLHRKVFLECSQSRRTLGIHECLKSATSNSGRANKPLMVYALPMCF